MVGLILAFTWLAFTVMTFPAWALTLLPANKTNAVKKAMKTNNCVFTIISFFKIYWRCFFAKFLLLYFKHNYRIRRKGHANCSALNHASFKYGWFYFVGIFKRI